MTAYGYTRERARTLHITASPLAHEAPVIARVQSMRTRGGVRAEPLSYAASVTYLRNVERVRKHPVTVPQPLCQSAANTRPDSQTPATPRADSFTENPYTHDEAPEVIARYQDIRGV